MFNIKDLIIVLLIYTIGLLISISLLSEDMKYSEKRNSFRLKLKVFTSVVLWPFYTPFYTYFFLSKEYRIRLYVSIILTIFLFLYIFYKLL